MAEWIPTVATGWAVGTGHFVMLEASVQVNAMIESFLDHYVTPRERAAQATSAER
jgi:hypothetical protein